MNTKKTLFILALIGLTLNSFAQGFGISATYNSAKLKVIYDGKVQPEEDFVHFNSVAGLGLELNYDIELSENLYGEIGASYQQKGLKYVVEGEGPNNSDIVVNYRLNYLQIPLHLKYNYEISDDTYIFGFGGFDIGFVLSGTISDSENSQDLKFGSNKTEDDFKSSDFGLTLGAGVLYNNFEFRLGFTNGLSDINPRKRETYNRVFFAGLGYRFNN